MVPTCHPERKHKAKGLCKSCYNKPFRKPSAFYWNERGRVKHLQKLYSLTEQQYQDLFDLQRGVCAICGEAPKDKHLAVDHDHATGKVRALLCTPCNHAIGLMKDSPKLLLSAAEYLQRHS